MVTPASSISYIGPPPPAGAPRRGQYHPKGNETPLRTDDVFKDPKATVHEFPNPDGNEPTPAYKYESTIKNSPSPKELVAEYAPMIREHVERRIIFFFHQLVLCYKTGLQFKASGALDQGASASAITVKDQKIKRNAAHSSTLPCLIAIDAEKHEFIFLRGSDFYRMQNATINMPRWVNEADIQIDGAKNDTSHLRGKALEILNEAASIASTLSPQEGLKKFLEALGQEIEASLERTNPESAIRFSAIHSSLDEYKKNLSAFQQDLAQKPEFLDRCLDLAATGTGKNVRETVLRLRYSAIQKAQSKQAELVNKVKTVQEQAFAILQKEGAIKKHPNLPQASFNKLLFTLAENKGVDLKKRFMTLLASSPTHFDEVSLNALKGSKTVRKLARKLFKELETNMKKLEQAEKNARGATLRAIRNASGMTQTQFGAQFKRMFPEEPASQSTISRMERTEKTKRVISSETATKLSRVFNIDPGLFMPQFFWS
jgi:predicted glycoside hydrolase/deacetylase ChbG (UPF0249 family)